MDEVNLRLELIRICHRPGMDANETTHHAKILLDWVKEGRTEKSVQLGSQKK